MVSHADSCRDKITHGEAGRFFIPRTRQRIPQTIRAPWVTERDQVAAMIRQRRCAGKRETEIARKEQTTVAAKSHAANRADDSAARIGTLRAGGGGSGGSGGFGVRPFRGLFREDLDGVVDA